MSEWWAVIWPPGTNLLSILFIQVQFQRVCGKEKVRDVAYTSPTSVVALLNRC